MLYRACLGVALDLSHVGEWTRCGDEWSQKTEKLLLLLKFYCLYLPIFESSNY